jgi:hypothetical protein
MMTDLFRVYGICLFAIAATVLTFSAMAETSNNNQAISGSNLVYSEDREQCNNQNATRNAYFGGLHVHAVLICTEI